MFFVENVTRLLVSALERLCMKLNKIISMLLSMVLVSCVSPEKIENIYSLLDQSEICCNGFRDLEYNALTSVGRNSISLTKESPVYSVENHNSYIEAFLLPREHAGHMRADIPLAKIIRLNQSFLYTKYLFLDKRFKVISNAEGKVRAESKEHSFENWRVETDVSIPEKAMYLVVYSGSEGGKLLNLRYNVDFKGDAIPFVPEIRLNLIAKPIGHMSLYFGLDMNK